MTAEEHDKTAADSQGFKHILSEDYSKKWFKTNKPLIRWSKKTSGSERTNL